VSTPAAPSTEHPSLSGGAGNLARAAALALTAPDCPEVSVRKRLVSVTAEPTVADLEAIEAEWPLIAAELDLLDAQITMLYAEDHGGPSPLDWRRLRRAEARVTRAAADLAAPVRFDPRRTA
jgi:hypothetical protein